jgi:ABC-2 type transport system ATP-binding protein
MLAFRAGSVEKSAIDTDTIIDVEGLRKAYGGDLAVDALDMSVTRGEIFGLLGPNGAGKTTTVECLQGLRRRGGGRVRVLGLDPDRDGDELRRRIGAQLQSSALPDRLRVGEALNLFARNGLQKQEVEELGRRWDLRTLWRRPFGKLSGGQQQRLFIALALLNQPEVVFFDELTTGLDPHARRTTWDLVRRVRDDGATVVLVTHFMEEAEILCDRVAIVDQGRVVATGRPDDLVDKASGERRVTFTWPDADIGWLAALPGVRRVSHAGDVVELIGTGSVAVQTAAALAHRGIEPTDFRTYYPNLEDVFLALTGRDLRS